MIVGKPVEAEKIPEPKHDQINHYHDKYVAALERLYDEYNPIYGNPNTKLFIAWQGIDTVHSVWCVRDGL